MKAPVCGAFSPSMAAGCAVLMAASATRADPPGTATPSATTVSVARSEFEAGVAATRRSDWAEARAAFERSYTFLPAPLTLLNLATAEANSGAIVAALEHYRRFLDVATAPPAASFRDEARTALERLEPRVPRVRPQGAVPSQARVPSAAPSASRTPPSQMHRAPAWYASPWFYGAIALGVAGSVTAGVVIATMPPGPIEGNTDPMWGAVR